MKSATGLTFELLKSGYDPSQIAVKLALRKALEGCQSVLDVGCGAAPTMRQLGVPRSVGFEGYQPSIDLAKKLNTHDEMIKGDLRDLNAQFQPKQFDAVIAMDVIEHVVKEDGLQLMKDMERIATKRVVLFTPCGFLPQRQAANDDLQAHLSGWEPDEMRGYGYKVVGLLGPKSLRGEYHSIKGRPRVFWGMVSWLGHVFSTKNHPENAAAILCVKTLS